jgi:branched-chain amino acid transport system permease protein
MNASHATAKALPLAGLGSGLRWGLIGGLMAVSIALQGMLQAFAGRSTVSGAISMGQTLLVVTYLLTAYVAAGRGPAQKRWLGVLNGTLSGFLSSLLLVGLIWLGSVLALGVVFVNATKQLYDLLTFSRGLATGSLMQLGFGLGAGLAAGLLNLMPPTFRRPIVIGIVTVVTLGFFQDWIVRTLANTPQAIRAPLGSLSKLVYARSGVSPKGGVGLFVLGAGISAISTLLKRPGKAPLVRLPSAGRAVYRSVGILLIGLLLLLLPALVGIENSEILDTVGMYLLMGLGLNIVVGFAGMLDLGYVAFFAIGAYTVGILTSSELGHLPVLGSWWVALPFGLVAAVLAGVTLGIPVLKMRGDYLAIVTLGFGEIVRIVAGSDLLKRFDGGAQGTRSIIRPDIGPIHFGIQRFTLPLLGRVEFQVQQEFYYIFLAACLVALFIAVRVKNSRLGRAWMAVREDEDVAQAMGINLVATKLLAFAMGAFFGGLSGAIFASKLGSIFPSTFNFLYSIYVLSLIIIGGMGSIPGVIVGAFALVAIPELLREFAEYRYLFFGAALVLMMLTRPGGLIPEALRRQELELSEGAPPEAAAGPPGEATALPQAAGAEASK